MTEFRDWSITASANTGNAVDGYFKENMAYSDVNDAARELQAIMARYRLDNSGVLVTTGSTGSYVVTVNATLTSYADGDTVVFQPHVKNDGASTMRLKFIDDTSLSDRPMVSTSLAALRGGELIPNSTYLGYYNSASANFRIANLPGGSGGTGYFGDLNADTLSVSGATAVRGSLYVSATANHATHTNMHGDVSISGALSVAGYQQLPIQYKYTTSTATASTTGYTAITGLEGFIISAGASYIIEAFVNLNAKVSQGRGFRFRLNSSETMAVAGSFMETVGQVGGTFPTTNTEASRGNNAQLALQNWGQFAAALNDISETNSPTWTLVGTYHGHASNNDTLDLRWGEVSSGASNTVIFPGAWMRLTRLGPTT